MLPTGYISLNSGRISGNSARPGKHQGRSDEMPIVSAGSVRVQYKVDGAGSPLALVSGTGADSEVTWGHLVEQFADRHTVIRPDYTLEDDAGELTIEALADPIAAAIDDAAIEPADVVGFSLGAPVVAAVAATRPALVRR